LSEPISLRRCPAAAKAPSRFISHFAAKFGEVLTVGTPLRSLAALQPLSARVQPIERIVRGRCGRHR